MAALANSIEIARTPAEVFAYVTDPSRFSEWQDAVVSAHLEDDRPPGPGSRMKLTRRMGGREQTVTSELTEYNPPRSYAFRAIDGPVRLSGKGRVEPLDGGARSRFDFELDFEAKGTGKLLLPLVRKQAHKELIESHRKLKERLESGAT